MEIPECLGHLYSSNDRNLVCRLKKAIYKLKHASRARYLKIDSFLKQQGFQRSHCD